MRVTVGFGVSGGFRPSNTPERGEGRVGEEDDGQIQGFRTLRDQY